MSSSVTRALENPQPARRGAVAEGTPADRKARPARRLCRHRDAEQGDARHFFATSRPLPRRASRCWSPARQAPARNCWRARCIRCPHGQGELVAVNVAGLGRYDVLRYPVRPHQGRLYRRRPGEKRADHAGHRRHPVPGRDRRLGHPVAGQIAAPAAGRGRITRSAPTTRDRAAPA